MQKFTKIIMICTAFFLFFSGIVNNSTIEAKAKTLGDLKAELQELERNDAENKDKIKRTESEINQIKSEIRQIHKDMGQIELDIIAKTEEINQLTEEIAAKDAETKELMNFLQVSSNGSVYLEYIAGAASLTDFIYRLSIVEQLTKYNSDLIEEMDQKIKQNEQAKIDLANRSKELDEKKVSLGVKVSSLGQQKEGLYEFERSLADEIKTAREVIKMYEDAGCKEHEDINVCANKLLPPDTRFWRPLAAGYVTSEYGYRSDPLNGSWSFHSGIDVSNYDRNNSPVYAAANGKVAKAGYEGSMGNYIIIHHNINGKNYTTQYLHMKSGSLRVRAGDLVTKDTIIGIMGTTGRSTGVHLHFSIASGLRYKDYYTYSDFIAHLVNPRLQINFPTGLYRSWSDRISKYN